MSLPPDLSTQTVNNPLDKTMTTDKHRDSTPGYGQPVNNCPKRYELGSRRYNNEVVPCMIEHPTGKYVLFDEYDTLQKICDLQQALINKQKAEFESAGISMKYLMGWRP